MEHLTYQLSVMSTDAAGMSYPDVLDAEHLGAFKKGLMRVLSTQVAEFTYAQIIDGLPTEESFKSFHFRQKGHPVFELNHAELCEGALEKARKFRSEFDPSILSFKSTLLSSFQQTKPDSKEFRLRLVELLAISCHQIAVYLFQMDDGIHKRRVYEAWRDRPYDRNPAYRAPTAFYHHEYVDFDQYPNGVADVAGYWAEAKVFGGVVVFDRGESGTEINDLYIHGGLASGPTTIYPPTTQQFKALADFLESPDGANAQCPLPIHATSQNRYRYNPWDSISRFHIFRDTYERKVSPTTPPFRCTQSAVDWPEIGDEVFVLREEYAKGQGEPFDEAAVAAAYERLRQITPSSPCWQKGMEDMYDFPRK